MRKNRKYYKKFPKRMQKKLIALFLVITFFLICLSARLTYIESVKGASYEKIVLSQQGFGSRTIPYQRGDIVDTKGTILATSLDVYNVILDCKVLNKNSKQINATILALSTCFPDLKAEELYQKLKDAPESQYVVLLRKLPYEQIQPYVEMQAANEKKYSKKKLKEGEDDPTICKNAVWFEKEYIRNYPYGSLAASVIGFVSGGNVGTTGLENYYNSTLNGINGREYGYLNSDNNFEKNIKEAKDGHTIVTTIDMNIQSIVEEKLDRFYQEHTNGYVTRPGFEHAAAIVMNPQNGEVYAMANGPTFDLNDPRDAEEYFTSEELAGLTDEEKMDRLNKLWENFCVSYTFEPGSTAKPLTVACGLETGTIKGDEAYYCDGVEDINGTKVHCVSTVGHGTETVEKALMDSCNDALMQMSYVIGTERFANYQNIFGFGQKTGIDLPGEERGVLHTADQMQKLDLATNSFGQNYTCTMIQLASAFSSLINGGKYYQPHIVKKILDSQGNTVETIKPVLLKETVSKETSDMVKTYLYKTVSEGTGSDAKVNGYSMGGKTGTAETFEEGVRSDENYLVSFVSYLPQEDPQLVIYLAIEKPNVEDQAHSTFAQLVTKEILEEILPYLNIYPDEELQPEPEEGDPEGDGSEDVPQGDEPPQEGEPQGEGEPPQEGEPQGGVEPPQEGEPQGDEPEG